MVCDGREFEIGRLPEALLVVGPRAWAATRRLQAWYAAKHLVVDDMRADDVGFAARAGQMQAWQPDEAGPFAVEVLSKIGSVLTHPGVGGRRSSRIWVIRLDSRSWPNGYGVRIDGLPHRSSNSSTRAWTRSTMSSRIFRTTSSGCPAGSSSFQSR